MAHRGCDREQELLLPPSVQEWLPEDHLAWFVIDAVAAMDLAFDRRARLSRRKDRRARKSIEKVMREHPELEPQRLGAGKSPASRRQCAGRRCGGAISP
jgi:hypothetical protein